MVNETRPVNSRVDFDLLFLAVALLSGVSVLPAGENLQFIEPREESGSSSAVVVGDWPLAHTTQVFPCDAAGRIAAQGPAEQFAQVLENLSAALTEAQSGLDRLVKLNVYVAKPEFVSEVYEVLAGRFRGSQKPAVALVVTRLPIADALVAADAVATTALDPGRAVTLLGKEESVQCLDADGEKPGIRSPRPVAVIPNGMRIYVAGQAVQSESLADATRKTLEGLRATLRFLGRSDADVVQLKAFLSPMSDAAEVQREVAAFCGDRPVPPLVLVEWKSSANLPIEIELVAWGGVNEAGDAVEFLAPPELKASPVFSRIARVNHSRSIYVSGLYATPPVEDTDPNHPAAGEREVHEVFMSLDRILGQARSNLRHLAKATYYVSTDAASNKLNELRPKYYDPQRPPAASKAVVADVGRTGLGLTLDMIAVPAFSEQEPEYGPPEFGHGLCPEDAAAGWISLFDGQTTFGWQDATVENGRLSGGETMTKFGNCEVLARFSRGGTISVDSRDIAVPDGDFRLAASAGFGRIRLGDGVRVARLSVRPLGLAALFNGRDMTGWRRIDHPHVPESKRPVWQVADAALHATSGPGCVEYQGRSFGDFVLQLDVRTRVRHANGGVFFRAIPGDFMNGYEAQVFNRSEDGDPARPARWSTGGLDDRQNARRMVSRDRQFFKMTVIADGPHIATWVNGFQQTDWTDTRPRDPNPRNGRRTEPGVLQLQAHDPGTDVEFTNVAGTEW